MDTVRTYLISILSAAMIASIAVLLTKNRSTISAGIKLISGLLLSITIIKPVLNQRFLDLTQYFTDIHINAEAYIDSGKKSAESEQQELIKDRVEAYIFDKATALGLDLIINVHTSESYPYLPVSVSLAGSASPYNKNKLIQFIEKELGISKEYQEWNE